MTYQSNIEKRLRLLELDSKPERKTHCGWLENGMTEKRYRKENGIPDQDKVIMIGWQS